jgi:flagellar biosynthesis protein FlhA
MRRDGAGVRVEFHMSRVKIGICVLALLVVVVFVMPLPTALLDLLILLNMVLSIAVLIIVSLTNANARSSLSFYKLPSILLTMTIFHITISVSVARAILSNYGFADSLIQSFGMFIAGRNLIFGVVIFLIIMLTQLFVIIKCVKYVFNISDWFTQDAMPGKQMGVDADLNADKVDEITAEMKRLDIQHEAKYFYSMVGTSKFVMGNAIFITIVALATIIGGIMIDTVMGAMDLMTALNIFIIATIGNGLTSAIPVLLLAVSMRISVTKMSHLEM